MVIDMSEPKSATGGLSLEQARTTADTAHAAAKAAETATPAAGTFSN